MVAENNGLGPFFIIEPEAHSMNPVEVLISDAFRIKSALFPNANMLYCVDSGTNVPEP